MKAAVGISTVLDPAEAGREAVERASQGLGDRRPELTVILATAAHGRGLEVLVGSARDAAASPVVGGSVEGIVARDLEVSSFPAVLAVVMAGADAAAFFVASASGDELRVGEEIAARVGEPGPDDLVVVLADSQSVDISALARGLPEGLDGAVTVGTGATATPRGRPLLWAGPDLESDAVAGWVLRGAAPRVRVVQAGRPVTDPLPITRARGNWILGIGGRPALDVYEEAARGLGLAAETGSAPSLLVGLVAGGAGELLVRNIVGVDPKRRALSIPEPVVSGRRLVLLTLDPEAAQADLVSGLASLESTLTPGLAPAPFPAPGPVQAPVPAPALALFLNCRSRGASLFGEPGVEARQLANAFADCPVVGVTGPFQLAPLGSDGVTALLTYAGVLALV